MATSNACWGIELGAGAIKALKLGRSGDDVELLDFAVIPHKKVLSTPELDQGQAMRVAVGALASQVDLSGAAIAISIPGHSSFARFAKLPPIEPKPKQVANVVTFEARQQIPFELEQVQWDYQTFMSPDSPDVEVGIFAVTKERINQILALLGDVGITPAVITVGPVAAYNGLAFDLEFAEDTPGTVILDVGTTSSDLIIAHSGRVWVRTFPIGGHHFTEALVEKFKLSYPKAEKLKREGQKTQYARHVLQAMRPVFQDLAQDVQRSIGYYQSLHSDARLVRLIAVGSTFELPGLRKYLKQQLQLNVYRYEQIKRLTLEGQRAADLEAHAPNMATAYGLALQGLGSAALEANLMPTPVIRQSMWRQKTKWFGVAAGVAIATGAAMFIRPFLDQQAVAGAPRSSLIDEAIREAESARRDATEVTSGSGADYTAANLIELAGGEPVVPSLIRDIDTMLGFAEGVNESWSAFLDGTFEKPDAPPLQVNRFEMQFLAPGGDAQTDPTRTASRGRGSRDDRRGAAGSIIGGGRGSPSDTTGTDEPGFRLTLEVETWHPEPDKFIVRSLDRWINDNIAREGVPYHLVVPDGGVWRKDNSYVVGADEEGTDRSSSARPTSPTRGRRDNLIVPGQPGRRGGIQEQPGRVVGEGGVFRPEGPASGGRSGGNQDLNELAPIPERPTPPPGTRVTTFTVEWVAVLGPAPEAEEGGDQ